METVVAVAIGILATIFVASLAGLLYVCRVKCKKTDLITSQLKDTRPDVQLIEEDIPQHPSDLELDDVRISNPRLDQLLQDESWVDDATGLVPHCIAILKTCHILTERLVGMTMGNSQMIRTQELLTEIVAVAKRISPRVDEVVNSMYPPLDPRLLEARCTALVLSVSHLVLVTKHACQFAGAVDWIDQSLADIEEHLKVLRAASYIDESTRTSSSSGSSEDSTEGASSTEVDNQSNEQSIV